MIGGGSGEARSAEASAEGEDGRSDRRASGRFDYMSLARAQSARVWETVREGSTGAVERFPPMHLGLGKSHVALQLLFSIFFFFF